MVKIGSLVSVKNLWNEKLIGFYRYCADSKARLSQYNDMSDL